MTGSESVIPPPLADDDDDVVWALQTAQVQWSRGATADAVVWLRRAVDSALQSGRSARAMELAELIQSVEERLVSSVFTGTPPQPSSNDVDDLLGGSRASVEVAVDAYGDKTDETAPLPPSEASIPHALPEPPLPPPQSHLPPPPRRVRPPPPPSAKRSTPPQARSHAPPSFPPPSPSFPPPPPVDDESPTHRSDHPPPEEVDPWGPEGTTRQVFAASVHPPKSEVERVPEEGRIGNVRLSDVRGLQDLPPEGHEELVRRARIETLDVDQEVSAFAVALIVEGWASIMPTIADVTCAYAQASDVVFADGTLDEGVALRVVAGETDTIVAVWEQSALEAAILDCPWVADDLRVIADRFQALAGATMGVLGERLDDTLRQSVTDRCTVRTFMPGEQIVDRGDAVPGMFILGAGRVELVGESGEILDELGPGDFLFAAEVMGASPAPATARAASSGALALFAERKTAHELMVSVPPLLEMLAT